MKNRAFGLLAFAVSASIASAQNGEHVPPTAPESFDQHLADWQSEHGPSWRAINDRNTGRLEMLYGGNVPAPFTPDVNIDEDWATLAIHWIAETHQFHGVEPNELVHERVVYLPLGMANGTDKITVRFSQRIQGLPVDGAFVNVLFDTAGRLLSIHTTAAPETDHIVIAPTVSGRDAKKIAQGAFERTHGVPALKVGMPMMEITQIVEAELRSAHLAYRVDVRNDAEPLAEQYIVSATTGNVLRIDEQIHAFDVTGQITSMATPGTAADHAGNPEVALPMSYIRVQGSNGQTVFTDRDGNFNFPGVNSALNLTVEYWGTFNNVNNQNGADYSVTFNSVQPNQANVLTMNPGAAAQVTAQANSYQHMNVLRDFIRDTVPTDNTADFQAVSNPNINSTCNAFFNGNSVNYYLQGGSCNNTAFSSVVAHELGHWLNVRYNTGNGSDGMGEGNADVFSMYCYDDPVVGRFFTTSGGFVRTGTNNRQYCGDGNGGCYGQVHTDGEVWMGAAWKVRTELKNSLGTQLGGDTANQLFLGWMNSYNQTTIDSIIETQWLTLDDNDGDIGNGTPNHQAIDDGFRQQGFPGHDLDLIQFSNITQLADVAADNGPYTVNADIVALLSPPVATANLNYSVSGGATQSVAMSPAGGDTFTADIPSIGGVGYVSYWISATDSNSGSESTQPLEFTVGQETVLYAYDFEAGNDEGWQGHLGTDTATTGEWERGDPIGTDAQSENDHTPGGGNTDCWFTGQGSQGGSLGENDVDGGQTTLLSPTFDLAGASSVQLTYWRWYSNDTGASPNNDTMRIGISNNDGASWINLETVGPTGEQSNGGWFQASHSLDAVISLTSTMRVRFIAEDAGDGSIVEAAVDDFEIMALDPGCPAPVNYCTAAVNSTGSAGQMVWNGSQDVNDNMFNIGAINLPSNQFGIFVYGPTQGSQSVGDGTLCIDGGAIYRLPVVQVGLFGDVYHSVDMTSLPLGGDIVNGDTVNFTLWFRDPAGGPAGYNFADGLNVTFCGN